MGNKTSSSTTSPSPSPPPPPSADVASSKDKAPVEREVDLPIAIASPPMASPEPRPISLHLESPTPIRAPKNDSDLTSSSFGLLAPIISVNISPPPISTGDQSPLFSGRATTSSPSPPPSPRSQISAGSSVTSAGGRAVSFFWNVQEQYYNRKMARRQSLLESAGRLGRPCCFTLQSITLQGTFSSTAQVQAEVTVLFEKAQPYLNHISELPFLRTSPRPPLRPGQVNIGGKSDVILLPSVTSSSILSVTVLLDGLPIGNVRYPLSEITATLRPTELRLTPAGAEGKKTPRSRSPSSSSSPFSSPLRRRHLSSSASPVVMSSPYNKGDANSDLMRMGLESLRVKTPSPPPPPPTTSGISNSSSSSSRPSSPLPLQAAAAGEGPPRLDAVWGEVVFYDNRSSGAGWVDLVEEGGKPVDEQRLLVVTPQSFALMDSPHCILGQEGYSMTEVRHVEPKGHSPLLPEKVDDLPRNISTGTTTTPPTSSSNSSSSTANNRPSGGGGGGGGGGRAMVTISVSCPEKGERDILLAVDSEEDARRWTQLLKRAAHDAAFGGAEKS